MRSRLFGSVLRSVKLSPPVMMYAAMATGTTAATQSHHLTWWRYRSAIGNRRKTRNRTIATWMVLSTWVGTMA